MNANHPDPETAVPGEARPDHMPAHAPTGASSATAPADHGNESTRRLEPEYFSPQPRRFYGSSNLPGSAANSTKSSPAASANASSLSVDAAVLPSTTTHAATATAGERPSVQRDYSSTSNASTSTVRPPSVDPLQTYTPSQHQRDGPHYPNQSYAALQSQTYPLPHYTTSARARTSQPHHNHHPSLSAAHIGTYSHPDHRRDIMETGSKTVGNSPASSPGLFSPSTPPLRHLPQSDDGYYSSPWLHHTHIQAPKETHVADVDVDPVSGRKIVNQYEIVDELGRGVHGKVKLGRNLDTGGTVAIKIVDRNSKRRRLGKSGSHEDKIKKEIAILKKARHENIVSLIEVIDDPSRSKVYIILEHVELGEVKWRTEGEQEVVLVEWRRFQRESQGIIDNDNALVQDQKILASAHQRLQREQRRVQKMMHVRRQAEAGDEAWSLEFGGESEGELSSSVPRQRASTYSNSPASHTHRTLRRENRTFHESNMETAVRSGPPPAPPTKDEPDVPAELEGTMYGAYDTDLMRGRTPSIAGSASSCFTEDYDEIPENFRYVPLLTIQAARETFRDTVLGLEYLHYQGVVHRDIKPANLLQTKEHRIKISDFGVSYLGRPRREDSTGDQSESDMQDLDETIELAKTVGTPAFYAPELCVTDPDAESYPVSGQIDVWALGVTLYCLIYGRVPFHDHNTFHLMKLIADTEVYIPKCRLRAVAEQNGSRPSSHGRIYPSMTASKRAPHESKYEEVDDLLQDLLRRLLAKDPRRRITIKEIKHHPWLLRGIDNPDAWMVQTDPSKSPTKKIEISKDDMEKAVVPLTLIERVRSSVRKTLDIFTSRRTTSRKRAQSSVHEHAPNVSANSSSSTVNQEGRRPSLAMNQSIFEALSRSRDPEHPLSHSVSATPEPSERQRFFESPSSRTASPAYSVEGTEHPAPLSGSMRTARPPPPERAHSTMSSAASIRTIRPTDPSRSGPPASPQMPPALPGTPLALESPGGSNLGGVFGGMPRHVVTNARSRELLLKPSRDHLGGKFIDRPASTDPEYSGASVALSTATATGHVDQPDLLKDLSPTLARVPSPTFQDYTMEPLERTDSRHSSISSASSYSRRYGGRGPLDIGPPLRSVGHIHVHRHRETSDERYSRAKDELVRQRIGEEKRDRQRPQSKNMSRPTSAMSQGECPPSPDDEMYFENQRRKVENYLNNAEHPSQGSGNGGFASSQQNLISSSSEEFTWMSQSTSNPSIPSVVSADSSIVPDEYIQAQDLSGVATGQSAESLNQFDTPEDDPAGYDGDDALESDDDSDDDFIMMGKKRPSNSRSQSGSITNSEPAKSSIHKASMTERRRSARSGSNGTVKKVPPPGESDATV